MSRDHANSGTRTMLMSVLMSAPGPLVMGLGLLAGQSSTQIADFIRRSAELLAIIMSFAVYRVTAGDAACPPEKRAKLEKQSNAFAGAMMCLGGCFMVGLAFLSDNSDKGNVIPGLVIALLGVVANTAFWIKYTRLNHQEPNAILQVQARLYRAKSLVDSCVTLALLSVVLAPASPLAYWLDFAGSLVVAGYLIWCGVQTLRENLSKN